VSTSYVTDADLVARARQGDSAAFGELVDRHRTAVYRAALAATGSHADADDVAQDAFVLAYRRLDSFRGEASFKTWLLSIAWRQALNRRRMVTRMLRRLVMTVAAGADEPALTLEATASPVATGPTPEEAAMTGELARAVRREIAALSPRLRDALLLAQSGEYSYDEIGAMLGVPVGTIKWRVSEARRLIRRGLEQRGSRI
jgi:RNA polymerase sigma-70 factor (ECF subfamily)